MKYTPKIKKMYGDIQNILFYIIPEKWDRLYLYASVSEKMEDFLTGEMYFYYFPKGILKMRPINVYEIPNKYNIAEEEYNKQLEKLYNMIKELWRECLKQKDISWNSITISIENFRFKIEYDYTDIYEIPYSTEQWRIIWKYKYLKKDIELYSGKEKRVIQKYIKDNLPEDIEEHEEPVYKAQAVRRIKYEKEEKVYIKEDIKPEEEEEHIIVNNEILLKRGIN